MTGMMGKMNGHSLLVADHDLGANEESLVPGTSTLDPPEEPFKPLSHWLVSRFAAATILHVMNSSLRGLRTPTILIDIA